MVLDLIHCVRSIPRVRGARKLHEKLMSRAEFGPILTLMYGSLQPTGVLPVNCRAADQWCAVVRIAIVFASYKSGKAQPSFLFIIVDVSMG